MQQILLFFAARALAGLALIFAFGLIAHKLYINVRSRYNISVNCWFCNKNTRVKYNERNSFTCPDCEQYNGFNKDGDYNRDMLSQRDCSTRTDPNSSHNSSGSKSSLNSHCVNAYYTNELGVAGAKPPPVSNGLCNQCNEAQRLKVDKLAQFEPKHESRFDSELKQYQTELEKQFRLCSNCERYVSKVLHEKKKMVLGSKFLNFIMKGAALLKQPHFNHLARVQQQQRLKRYHNLAMIITGLNMICLLCSLPTATLTQFSNVLGETLAQPVYFIYSHALTLLHIQVDFISEMLEQQATTAKILKFARTMGKLFIYSLGLTQVQAQHVTFSSCYISIYPYAMLGITSLHNITNGLKFTRFTVLLLLWSVYAQGSLLAAIDGISYILLGNVITLLLLLFNRSRLFQLSYKQSIGDSFHQLCASECIIDDESISMLSQQLNCSINNSNMSRATSRSSNSYASPPQVRQCGSSSLAPTRRYVGDNLVAPSVLSLASLHLSSQQQHQESVNPMSSSASLYRRRPNNDYRSLDPSTKAGSVHPTAFNHNPFLTRHGPQYLLPSRLHINQTDISAWVNSTSGNQHPEILEEPTTANLMRCCNDGKLSPSLSQSSGFESQPHVPPTEVSFWSSQQQQQPQQQQQQLFQRQLPQQPQKYLLQDQQLQQMPLTNNGLNNNGWARKVNPPMLSPYSTQSDTQSLWRTTTASHPATINSEMRPGDLLRKWMDRNGCSKQKANG